VITQPHGGLVPLVLAAAGAKDFGAAQSVICLFDYVWMFLVRTI
jgi:hypothetical protein